MYMYSITEKVEEATRWYDEIGRRAERRNRGELSRRYKRATLRMKLFPGLINLMNYN